MTIVVSQNSSSDLVCCCLSSYALWNYTTKFMERLDCKLYFSKYAQFIVFNVQSKLNLSGTKLIL